MKDSSEEMLLLSRPRAGDQRQLSWSGGRGTSTCVGSLSGGSAVFRELWGFGGTEEARDGSGIGARLGRWPPLSPEKADAAGFVLDVLSRAGVLAEGAAGGTNAGVSSVGANRWISVRESGAGGNAWISVRDVGAGVGNGRGGGLLR